MHNRANYPPVQQYSSVLPRGTTSKQIYVVRGVGLGNFVPQWAQFCQRTSTGWPQCGQVGFTEVPQFGQNANFANTFVPHCGQVVGSLSRRMKYRIMPMASGRKMASSVHMTCRMPRCLASP